ncbi:MAG: hypothetical protein M3N13_04115 [Candidatus Eremiobacteraeota bacterium]|nr:hypothetical protein [Candidatus Eremiobacteraeota bacterium]
MGRERFLWWAKAMDQSRFVVPTVASGGRKYMEVSRGKWSATLDRALNDESVPLWSRVVTVLTLFGVPVSGSMSLRRQDVDIADDGTPWIRLSRKASCPFPALLELLPTYLATLPVSGDVFIRLVTTTSRSV